MTEEQQKIIDSIIDHSQSAIDQTLILTAITINNKGEKLFSKVQECLDEMAKFQNRIDMANRFRLYAMKRQKEKKRQEEK